jgi:hypothetical protein
MWWTRKTNPQKKTKSCYNVKMPPKKTHLKNENTKNSSPMEWNEMFVKNNNAASSQYDHVVASEEVEMQTPRET